MSDQSGDSPFRGKGSFNPLEKVATLIASTVAKAMEDTMVKQAKTGINISTGSLEAFKTAITDAMQTAKDHTATPEIVHPTTPSDRALIPEVVHPNISPGYVPKHSASGLPSIGSTPGVAPSATPSNPSNAGSDTPPPEQPGFNAATMMQLQNLFSGAVEEGTSKAMATEGRGSLPHISNPLIVYRPEPRIPNPNSYDYGEGFVGAYRSTASLLSHKLHGKAKDLLHSFPETNLVPSKGETLGETGSGPGQTTPILDHQGNDTGRTLTFKGATSPATPTEAQTLVEHGKKIEVTSHKAQILQSAASGRGLLAGFATAVPEIAAVTIGLQAAKDALNVVPEIGAAASGFRNANAQYQNIYGGSNLSGVGQRFQQEMFHISTFGDLSGQQSSELFKGASQLGLQGKDRQTVLDYGVKMFNEFGISIKDSLELIRTSAEGGNKGLLGLADSIKYVTETASKNGLNAGVYQQVFAQNQQQISKVGGNTQGSNLLSGALTGVTASFGRGFEGVSIGAGVSSDSFIALAGATSGMGASNYAADLSSNNPQDQLAAAKAIDKTSTVLAGPIINSIAAFLRSKNLLPPPHANEQEQTSWAVDTVPEVLRGLPNLGLEYNSLAVRMVNSMGFNVQDQKQAIQILIMKALNQINPQQGLSFANHVLAAQQKASVNTVTPDKAVRGALKTIVKSNNAQPTTSHNTKIDGSHLVQHPSVGWTHAPSVVDQTLSKLNPKDRAQAQQILDQYNVPAHSVGLSPSAKTALTHLSHGGSTNPALTQIKNDASLKNRKYVVQTDKGDRTVSSGDLIKYYSDQVSAGTVRFADNNAPITSEVSFTPNSNAKVTSSTKDPQGKSNKAVLGTIMISPTQKLNDLLNFSGGNGLNVQTAYANNVPPTNTPQVPYGASGG